MRFKIQLIRTSKSKYLPVDYQYSISAWIYRIIGSADPVFSDFLHHQGYMTGNKQFKLFCYSPLDFGKPVLWREKALFEISGSTIDLMVSFQLAEPAEKFIIGLFNNQKLYLGDRFNGIDLAVSQIERLPDLLPEETMTYRAVSPVVVSIKTEVSKYARYLSPNDDDYSGWLKRNLLNKYNAIPGHPEYTDFDFYAFKLLNTPRSKLVTIKPHTKAQSKVRGFVYDFSLACPVEIHQLILSAGIGEKNAVGFGWVEIRTNTPAIS